MLLRRPFTPTTIADDRGRSVPLWTYRSAARSDDPVQRSIAIRAVNIEAAEFRRFSIFMGIGFVVVAIISVAVGIAPPWLFGFAVIFVLFGQLWQRDRIRRKIAPAVRLTLLSEVCCPSCAYDLMGLSAENDGRTTCPECHAGWAINGDMLAARRARERLAKPAAAAADEIGADRRARDSLRRSAAWVGWRRTYAARDARGRMVDLVNPGLFAPRPPLWNTIPRPERRALWRRLYAVGWPLRVFIATVSIPTMAFSGVFFLLRVGPAALPGRPIALLIGIFQAVVLPLIFLGLVLNPMTRSGKPLIRIMRRAGRCPSCAGPLPDEKGEQTCPACRAAWAHADPKVPAPAGA